MKAVCLLRKIGIHPSGKHPTCHTGVKVGIEAFGIVIGMTAGMEAEHLRHPQVGTPKMKLPTIAFDIGCKHHIAPQERCDGRGRKEAAVDHVLHDKHLCDFRHIGTSEGRIETDGHQAGTAGFKGTPVDGCRSLEA